MENIKADVKGKTLTLTVDLSAKGRPSASGKTTVVATTGGFVSIEGGLGVKFGLNVIRGKG